MACQGGDTEPVIGESRAMRWFFLTLFGFALFPIASEAHAVERGLVQLLPTDLYLIGGAMAVLISICVTWFVPPRQSAASQGFVANDRVPTAATRLVEAFAFSAFVSLVLIGFLGPRDPLENLAVLSVWTVFWIFLPGVTVITGSLWPWLNPWSGVLRFAAKAEHREMPRWLGHWPATIGLAALLWFDLAWISPRDPEHVATALLIYWGAHTLAQVRYGSAWRDRGETFTVMFALLGHLSPFRGRGLSGLRALPFSGWVFVTLTIAGITADGLMASFWWFEALGNNPLDPPARSETMMTTTLGLIIVWVGFSCIYAGMVWCGARLAGAREDLRDALGRFGFSLLPVAIAYHLAHFLTHFLVNGQYVLVALSDPFGAGQDWLGLGHHFVTTSFLNNLHDMLLIWHVQVALIVMGHLAGVFIAHRIAQDLYGVRAFRAGLPMGALMIGMTVMGLWLLSTPAVG